MITLHNIIPAVTILCIITLLFGPLFCSKGEMPTITVKHGEIKPISSKVLEGNSVTIICGSSSPVTWMFPHYAIRLNRHEKHPFKVRLKNLKVADSGPYLCLGVFENGELFFKIGFIKVIKKLSPGEVVPYPIVIAGVGDSIHITCGSTKPVTFIGVHHYIQSDRTHNNTFSLHNLRRNDSGRYLCVGVDADGEVFHQLVNVVLGGSLEVIPSYTRPYGPEDEEIEMAYGDFLSDNDKYRYYHY